jgi:hypothetical protein
MERDDSSLADSLMETGRLTREQLAAIFAEQQARPGSSLVGLLVEKGVVRPEEVAGSAANTGLPPEVVAAMADPRRRVGRYVLLSELGHGGMGIVYRAFDSTLKRNVAIKMILDPARAGDEQVKRFIAEAHATAKLAHPGIVSVYEIGQHANRPFIAMELVVGESLEKQLQRAPADARRAAELGKEIALALEHAHKNGIVHRDVKPENVLIDREGRTHLMDFGLAQDASRAERLTVSGAALGTPAYMAPEQAGDRSLQGPCSDIYSLGALLYRALAGRPPFEGTSFAEIIKKVVLENPKPLRELDPNVPAALDAVVLRCLAKEPKDRYPSAAALAQDLESFLATGHVSGVRPSPKLAAGIRTSGSRPIARPSGERAVARVPSQTRGALPPDAAPASQAGPKIGSKVALLAGGGGVLLLVALLVVVRLASSAPPPPVKPLELEILEPRDASAEKPRLLAQAALTIEGRLSDPQAGPVRVLDGERELLAADVGPDGRFSAAVTLSPGTKSLAVRAGVEGRAVEKAFAVEVDADAPRIDFTDPPESCKPGAPFEVVAHVVSRHPESKVRFSLFAGESSPETTSVAGLGADGSARASFEAKEGTARLRVLAEVRDALGRTASGEISIRVESPPPPTPEMPAPPAEPPPAPAPAPPAPSAADFKLVLEPAASPTNATVLEVRGSVVPAADGFTVDVGLDQTDAPLRTLEVKGGRVAASVSLPKVDGSCVVKVRVHAPGGVEIVGDFPIVVDRAAPDVTVDIDPKPDPDATTLSLVITASKPLASLKANDKELVSGPPSAGPFGFHLDVPVSGEPVVTVVALDVASNPFKKKWTLARPPKGGPDIAWEKGFKLPDHVKRGRDRLVYVYSPPNGRKKKVELEMVFVSAPAAEQTGKVPVGFFIGRTPITWKQYRDYGVLTGTSEPPRPSHVVAAQKEDDPAGGYDPVDERPVTMVDRGNVERFCQWAGVRLPTEAEWERTATGDTGNKYPWGNTAPSADLCWGREGASDGKIAPPLVGKQPHGASPFGALDMLGCVWEYCAGNGAPIRGAPFIFPRAICAGGLRGGFAWDGADWRVGFRVVLDLPRPKTSK